MSLGNPADWPRRHVRRDQLPELVHLVANRLVEEGFIDAVPADTGSVGHDAAAAVDRFAVEFNPVKVTPAERERLYRIWVVRLVIEDGTRGE